MSVYEIVRGDNDTWKILRNGQDWETGFSSRIDASVWLFQNAKVLM